MEQAVATLMSFVSWVGGPMVVLSGATVLVAYSLFVWSALFGPFVPNKATWTVWCVQDGLMAIFARSGENKSVAMLPGAWASGALVLVFIAFFIKGKNEPLKREEKACLALSGVGIFLSFVLGPTAGLVATMASAYVGGWPTLEKAWKDPTSEPGLGWILMLTASSFAMLGIEEWDFASGFLPVAAAVLQVNILIPITLHRIKTYARR